MAASSSATPAACAPRKASVRASISSGRATTAGSARASDRNASSAAAVAIGPAVGAYIASTACAMAFIPLAALTLAGNASVQIRVVHDESRRHAGVAAGAFRVAVSDAPDAGHLGPRVGGRHHDDGQPSLERNRLGQPDGRSAAYGQERVGCGAVDHRSRRPAPDRWARAAPPGRTPQRSGRRGVRARMPARMSELTRARRGDNQWFHGVKGVELSGQLLDGPDAEDDPGSRPLRRETRVRHRVRHRSA